MVYGEEFGEEFMISDIYACLMICYILGADAQNQPFSFNENLGFSRDDYYDVINNCKKIWDNIDKWWF